MTTKSSQNARTIFNFSSFTALCLLITFHAHAQIEWVNSPDTLAGEGTLVLDLNGDGTDDVLFEIVLLPIEPLASRAQGLNGTSLLDNSGFGYFDALQEGQAVEGNFTAGTGVLGTFNNAGQFNDGEVHYLGIQLSASGQNHFAWMALRVNPDNDTIFIDSYAWNTEAGAPISAGQTGVLHTRQSDKAPMQLWPNPARDEVQLKLPQNEPAPYRIYALNGTLLEAGITQGRIALHALQPGLYMLQVGIDGGWETMKLVVE